jgi:hypothetical protein
VEGASTSSSLESTSVAAHARRIARRIRRFWSASAWRLSSSAGGGGEREKKRRPPRAAPPTVEELHPASELRAGALGARARKAPTPAQAGEGARWSSSVMRRPRCCSLNRSPP